MWVRNVCCSRGLRVVGNDDDDDDDDDKDDKAAAAAACIDIDARALGGGDAMKNLLCVHMQAVCIMSSRVCV